MAYNYLTLTNDVCHRLNEVSLTTSNFSSASNQYLSIKDSVNFSIRDLNQSEFEWPFNYNLHSETLVAGQSRYSFPSNYKTSSMDTFRVRRNATFGNETVLLKNLTYEDYMSKHIDDEYNTSDESIRDVPRSVSKTPDLKFVVHPVPDEAYTLDYEYYSLPTDLVLASDIPAVPEQFRKVIVEGAMYYMYTFRSDIENAQLSMNKFKEGVKDMRTLYINRYDYMKSTMIEGDRRSSLAFRR